MCANMLRSFTFIDLRIHAERNMSISVSVAMQTEVPVAVNGALQFICAATRCSHITLQNLQF